MRLATLVLGLWLLLVPGLARAQPAPTAPPREVELQVVSGPDGGVGVRAEDAARVGVSAAGADGGATVQLVPPALVQDAPAAHPPGLEAVRAEVHLELLVDEAGAVADVAVQGGSDEARFRDAASTAARALRFSPATLGGTPVRVRVPFTYRFEPAPTQTPAARATLEGTVRQKGTRRPIAGAAVLRVGQPEPLALTDAEGHFRVDVPPGELQLEVRAPAHKPATLTETLQDGQRLTVLYRLEPTEVRPYETVVRDERPRTEVSRVTLHEEELREVPGTLGDPFRVVMLMPGVGSLASGVSYPVVRGSQPAATAFLLDGVRVPLLYHLLLGPAVVHPDFLDSVDFYAGGAPARYGRLLGGVVEGHLSRPREDRLHFTATADFINAAGFVEYPFQSTGTSLTAAARVSYTGLMVGAASKLVNEPEAGRVRADFYDYQVRAEQRLGGGGRRLRLFVFGASDVVGADASRTYGGGAVRTRFHKADLRLTQGLAGGEAEAALTAGWEDVGIHADEAGPTRVGEYALQQATLAARTRWTRELAAGRVKLDVGADLEHRRAATVVEGRGMTPGYRPGPEASPLEQPSSLGTFAGVYVDATWTPAARWTLVPGLRLDSYHLAGGALGTQLALEPRLAARYALTDAVTLKAGAGRYHQAPTVLVHLPVLDTAGLRYGLQRGWQLDTGAEWRPQHGLLQGFHLSADAFYNPLDRTVEFDLERVFLERRRRGLDGPDAASRGHAYGLDLMARRPLGRGGFGWVSYSFLQSRRDVSFYRHDDAGAVSGEALTRSLPFAFEQAHVLNAALSYQLPRNWTVGAVVHLNTGRPESGDASSRTQRPVTDAQGELGWVPEDLDRVQRLPLFWRVDLRAAKAWSYDDFRLELSLDILNASVQRETFAYTYGVDQDFDRATGRPVGPEYHVREPTRFPVVLPMLGLKATY